MSRGPSGPCPAPRVAPRARRGWEEAEVWHARNAERYPESSFADWFFFCKRTGHGNVAGARAFTEKYIQSLGDNGGARDTILGCFYWLDGQHEKAKAAFTRSCKPKLKAGDGVCLAVLLDQAGDAALRNTLMKEIVAQAKKPYSPWIEVLLYVNDTVLDPGDAKKALDPSEVERRIQACPENQRSFVEFFVAGFLKNHGQVELARKLYGRCTDSPTLWVWYQYITKDALKSMKDKRP